MILAGRAGFRISPSELQHLSKRMKHEREIQWLPDATIPGLDDYLNTCKVWTTGNSFWKFQTPCSLWVWFLVVFEFWILERA